MSSDSKTFAEKAVSYFLNLDKPRNLPGGIETLNPYNDDDVKTAVNKFFRKFFNDTKRRVFIFGINPGRFGGGKTGVSFTDPVALREFCGVENPFGERRELSSEFVYEVIEKFGGVRKFYSEFFLTAVYPLAIIKEGKNHNYYDSAELFNALKSEIITSLRKQFEFGAEKSVAISFGKKNAEYLEKLNGELNLFEKTERLEHPRFIMQYRRKQKDEYVRKYLNLLRKVANR